MEMMRMGADGKNLMCRSCLDRKPEAKKSGPVSAQKAQSTSKPQQGAPEMASYFCNECKYSFKRAYHVRVSTCPYCDASGSVVEKGSSSSILSDASKMK